MLEYQPHSLYSEPKSMVIVSDVSVEMVDQLQEVLDAKAAEMTTFRDHMRASNSRARYQQFYKDKLEEVLQSEERVREAGLITKLKHHEGKVVLSGDPPIPSFDYSPALRAESDAKVLRRLHVLEHDCDTLKVFVELYRSTFQKDVAANKANKEAMERLEGLTKKHGYVQKRGAYTKASLDDGWVSRGGDILVHPLYEAAYDAGNYNVEKKGWEDLRTMSTPPKWAVLDTSEF